MNILVDGAMPYWQDYFSSLGNVKAFKAGDIMQQDLHDVKVLLVRSTTKVNEALLAKMPQLIFVGTATAGYDHLDVAALETRNIAWSAAGGCNASAVTQYVVCALLFLACSDNFVLTEKKVAIVGNGNVGKRLSASLRGLGIKVINYDPPLARLDKQNKHYVEFEQVLTCDIICLHAPLDSDDEFPSRHMFNDKVLANLNEQQYIVNAGRGELIDNQALLALKQNMPGKSVNVVLDVWENEPTILRELIPYCRLVSAHIAGHTLDGRAAGTHILYEHLCDMLHLERKVSLASLLPRFDIPLNPELLLALTDQNLVKSTEIQTILKKVCFCVYDIANDDSVFRRYMAQSSSFAELRQQYPIRREFSASTIDVSHKKIQELLTALGFIISNGSTTPP